VHHEHVMHYFVELLRTYIEENLNSLKIGYFFPILNVLKKLSYSLSNRIGTLVPRSKYLQSLD
jgi:hypothetical protein